jgi:hypothetical protein
LKEQALLYRACTDTGWIKILELFQNPPHPVYLHLQCRGNLFRRSGQVTMCIKVAHDMECYLMFTLLKDESKVPQEILWQGHCVCGSPERVEIVFWVRFESSRKVVLDLITLIA